jgi:hypothetical protein
MTSAPVPGVTVTATEPLDVETVGAKPVSVSEPTPGVTVTDPAAACCWRRVRNID